MKLFFKVLFSVFLTIPALGQNIGTINRKCQSPAFNGFSPRSVSFQRFAPRSIQAAYSELKPYRVLLYTGLSGDILSSGPISHITGSRYFGTLPKALTSAGVENAVVDWPWGIGADSVANNAQVIIKDLKRSTKKAVIVAHSKGGADVIEALKTLYLNDREVLRTRIKAVVLLQAAFAGSPLADTVVARAASVFSGVRDMQTSKRRSYIRKNLRHICQSTRFLDDLGIKVVNLLTVKKGQPSGLIVAYQRLLGLLESTSGFQQKPYHCGFNDGFIDLTEGVIPCATIKNYVDYSRSPQFDHLDLAFRNDETKRVILQVIKKAL